MHKIVATTLLAYSTYGFSEKAGLCAVSPMAMINGMGTPDGSVMDSDWMIAVNSSWYTPGSPVGVQIIGPPMGTFRGILLYALTQKGGHIGQWATSKDFHTLDQECARNGPPGSTLSHSNSSSKKSSIVFVWNPPKEGAGNITFKGIIVTDERTSWALLGNYTMFGNGTAPNIISNDCYNTKSISLFSFLLAVGILMIR
jgi:hypothetical protein